MISLTAPLTSRNIKEFCEGELTSVLTAREAKAMQRSLTRLLALGQLPPRRGRGVDIAAMARSAGIDTDRLQAARKMLWPLLRALVETTVDNGVMPESDIPVRKRRGPMPRVVVEFPEPVETEWAESNEFGAALRLHARRHGESIYHLYNAVVRPEDGVNRSTLIGWGRGARMPRTVTSLEILGRIERRYRLPAGYFRRFMGNAPRAASGHALKDISPSERRRLAWHLPEDFNRRTPEEQAEILDWVRSVIISGSTEYRRYQAAAIRQRFGMRFNCAKVAVARRGRRILIGKRRW